MTDEILFFEKQKFKQWWIWLILLFINASSLYAVFQQIIYGIQFGNNPMSNSGLLITAVLLLLMDIIFLIFRLETQVKSDGIYVRFFPFHLKFKYYNWNSLVYCYVRQYKPIREFGGWGIRYGMNGKAYNISGSLGLQLEFTDGKRLLIGTNKFEELNNILNSIDKIKPEK